MQLLTNAESSGVSDVPNSCPISCQQMLLIPVDSQQWWLYDTGGLRRHGGQCLCGALVGADMGAVLLLTSLVVVDGS